MSKCKTWTVRAQGGRNMWTDSLRSNSRGSDIDCISESEINTEERAEPVRAGHLPSMCRALVRLAAQEKSKKLQRETAGYHLARTPAPSE